MHFGWAGENGPVSPRWFHRNRISLGALARIVALTGALTCNSQANEGVQNQPFWHQGLGDCGMAIGGDPLCEDIDK